MSGLFRTLLLEDIGNWLHSVESQSNNAKQRNRIRRVIKANYDIDTDQEKRIIQLEVLCGSLLSILMEKKVLSQEEIENIVNLAEESAVDLKFP